MVQQLEGFLICLYPALCAATLTVWYCVGVLLVTCFATRKSCQRCLIAMHLLWR